MAIRPTPYRGLPHPLEAQRFLIRARQYREQAILLTDMVGPEPNWPKYFLMTHAIELAINAYLAFDKGLREIFALQQTMSALPPNADISGRNWNVR